MGCGSHKIHQLVWSAFEEDEIGDRMILHKNGDEYLRTNEDGKTINVYTNEIESLYLGDAQQNSRDKVADDIAWCKRIPSEEYRIYDEIGHFDGNYHSVQEFVESRPENNQSWVHLNDVLKGNRISCHGFTIEHVIKRPNMPLHVRVGKTMLDIKTNTRCVIKELRNRGCVDIEFCNTQLHASRKHSKTNPTFKEIT